MRLNTRLYNGLADHEPTKSGAFRPRSTPLLKGCRWLCLTRGPLAARRARAPGSRTTSAFRPEYPARLSRARAFIQAQKFGAHVTIPATAKTLDCSRANGAFALETEGGDRIQARAVVVASGARYRRPAIPDIAHFEGRGVWYGRRQLRRACAGEQGPPREGLVSGQSSQRS